MVILTIDLTQTTKRDLNEKNKLTIKDELIEFLIYKSDNQDIKVDVLIQDEDIWLSMEQMVSLFGKG